MTFLFKKIIYPDANINYIKHLDITDQFCKKSSIEYYFKTFSILCIASVPPLPKSLLYFWSVNLVINKLCIFACHTTTDCNCSQLLHIKPPMCKQKDVPAVFSFLLYRVGSMRLKHLFSLFYVFYRGKMVSQSTFMLNETVK